MFNGADRVIQEILILALIDRIALNVSKEASIKRNFQPSPWKLENVIANSK